MALTEERRNPWRAIVAGGDYNLSSQDWEDLLTELDSLYAEAPIAQPASAPTGWDAEFLSKRLGRVAKLAGVSIPERFTHEQVAEAAGTILGQIAAAMEAKTASAPSEQKPVVRDWEEDFKHENGNYFNICCECKNQFIGHKRRAVCKACTQPDYKAQREAELYRWLLVSALASHAAHAINNCISPKEEPEMTTLSKEDDMPAGKVDRRKEIRELESRCADLVTENERLKEAAMFFSTYTDPDELEMDEIENAARESFRRANSGVRGTTITRANSYESHVIWATKARISKELTATRAALAAAIRALAEKARHGS